MAESPDTRLLSETNGRTMFVPRGDGYANVKEYLAADRVRGVTDDLPAFEAARQTGRPVYAPADTYYLSGSPGWGNGSVFRGDGKRKTIIKLLDTAPASALWSNANMSGNVQGYFADFTLDGNCQRQGGTLVAAGGSRSSTLTFRNVRHFYVDRVESINAVQHGFDVTNGSLDYPYAGDGNLAGSRSSDVYFDRCEASNFGDDGFTTHSSDHVHFTRCVGYDPRRRENCNAFEIDGDSRHITLTANRSYGCYAGIEIKGHGSESAAQDVTINGHRDIGSVRSYNFRHIGYHSGTNPVSKSAKNILATNLTSINPNKDKGFQDDATPRALSISAYQGVSITGMTIIGRGDYGAGAMAVAVQFRSADINLSGLNITGWGGADEDVSVTSGDNVTVTGLTIRASSRKGLYVGSTVTSFNLFGMNATGPAGGTNGFDIYTTAGTTISGVSVSGYAVPARADFIDYPSIDAFHAGPVPLPAGVTALSAITRYNKSTYLSTTEFGTMTDKPAGVAGAFVVTNTRNGFDTRKQTLTRNTVTLTPEEYFRVISDAGTPGPWVRYTLTTV